MLSDTLQTTLNGQIHAELYSGYLYLAMAAWLESNNRPGMSQWMLAHAEEEVRHAMSLYKYILTRRGHVQLDAVQAPAATWASPQEVFEAMLAQEQAGSARVNRLVEQADAENDHATSRMLQPFVDEQVEEENVATHIVDDFRQIADSPQGLLLLDRELGRRSQRSEAVLAEV